MKKVIMLLIAFLQICLTGCSGANSSTSETNKEVNDAESITETSAPHGDFIAKSKDGKDVYNRTDSHFHTEGGFTMELLQEVIEHTEIVTDEKKEYTYAFDRIIGKTYCVEVDPEKDEIVYVYRKGRKGQTPMVKNREPEDTNALTVIIGLRNGYYQVISAYSGESASKEPWDGDFENDPEGKKKAEEFWTTHALVYQEDAIDFERTDLK